TGTHAAACGNEASTRPPTLSGRPKPSPVLPAGPGEKCSVPVGAWGNNALRRATSCGKPPHATRTPRRATTRIVPSSRPIPSPPHEGHAVVSRAQHHPEDGELRARRPDVFDVAAAPAPVERRRDHGAPAPRPAGRIGMIIGTDERHVATHCSLFHERVDRLPA